MKKEIYFDNNSTTKLSQQVLEEMIPFLKDNYGNPSSSHNLGYLSKDAVNKARSRVAEFCGVYPNQVIFTSGGTEANNLFVKGVASLIKPNKFLTSEMEHSCVYNSAIKLKKSGWNVDETRIDENGELDVNDFSNKIKWNPKIVSVISAQNETGVINPISELVEISRKTGTIFHTDAVQLFGKKNINFSQLGVDALSISAHKIQGPKGAGALIVNKNLLIDSLIDGGGHEMGYRAGTENVPAIVGFGKACELAQETVKLYETQVFSLTKYFEAQIKKLHALIFCEKANRLTNTSFFSIPGIYGETLVLELSKENIYVSSGSACSNLSDEASRTLLNMKVDEDIAKGAVRVSFGVENTKEEVDNFMLSLNRILKKISEYTALEL